MEGSGGHLAAPAQWCYIPAMYHGEYKTPGGKLVKVDFLVVNGAFSCMEVTGDFFLYPDEAFAVIAPALEEAPADSGEAEIARRIAAALPEGTEWLGCSPEAVAIAVTRALEAGEGAAQ